MAKPKNLEQLRAEKEQSELTAAISALEKAVKSYEKHEKDADHFICLLYTSRFPTR